FGLAESVSREVELPIELAQPLLVRAQLLLLLVDRGRDVSSSASFALELALDLAEALLTCGVLVPQTFQLDARTLRLQPAVDAAGGFGLELAFQLPHSLLLRTEGLLGLGTGAVRQVELTLEVTPAIVAVIAFGPQPLELGACLLELLRPRLGFES